MADGSIQRPSRPIRTLFALERFFRDFGWFFPGGKYAFFVAADPLMGVQALQGKFCCGNLGLWSIFWPDIHTGEFVHEALDGAQGLQDFSSSRALGQLNFSAEIKPLNHLLHIDAAE